VIPRRACVRGFTLLEMTVVLLLVALMSSVIMQGLTFGMRSYAQVVKGNDANWNLFLTQRFLRDALETTYPFDPQRSANQAYGLQGTASRLSFSAAMARSTAPGALNRYELFAAADDRDTHQQNLVLNWGPDRNGRTSTSARSEVLVKNIERVELSYARTPCNGGNIQWLDAWQGHRTLPALVRMRVIFPNDDRRQWPELIVGPRVSSDATSWLDPAPDTACGRQE